LVLRTINPKKGYSTIRKLREFGEYDMPQIMTTKELAKYLKLHEITICKYAAEGKIPAIRIGRVWRFDKEAIDKWIGGGQKK
jgi:excisionase family DNA binding protein